MWVSGDRIKETTTTTGTGDITLAGAVAGYQAFSSVAANLDVVFYTIAGGTEWEVGLGTWTTGGVLQRTQVLASSNAGALVNFSAGSKDVFADFPAVQALSACVRRIASADTYLPESSSLVVADEYEINADTTVELRADAILEVT